MSFAENQVKPMSETKEPTILVPPPPFSNPWPGLKDDKTAATINCRLPKDAFVRIKQCRLEGGTIQTTMNHLWIKLIDLLERRNVQSYADVREFEQCVRESLLIMPDELRRISEEGQRNVPGSTTSPPDAQTNVGNDGGGTDTVRDTPTQQPSEPNATGHDSQGSTKRVGRKGRAK